MIVFISSITGSTFCTTLRNGCTTSVTSCITGRYTLCITRCGSDAIIMPIKMGAAFEQKKKRYINFKKGEDNK
ncbi:hypothetical protein DERP_006867 [Dermatophagoides pteronyssinus]|uniref:Secreted protein n=1 Tax=Dermatophagoides pteronyssinus TaxID=6956 RepID=A0ABQ8IS83_DERPT|nr:hypothetical protein DERP_006867 [Dermatophagoides pteronyssinus]